MVSNTIRARKPDRIVRLDEVRVPSCHVHAISRLRETGHVPYRCTRSYRIGGTGQK